MRNNYNKNNKDDRGGKRIGKSRPEKISGTKKERPEKRDAKFSASKDRRENSESRFSSPGSHREKPGSKFSAPKDRREKSDAKFPISKDKPVITDSKFTDPGERKYKKPAPKYDKRGKGKFSEKAEKTEDIRLNKFIAKAGICSRREADTYISAGMVTINGQIVSELGTKVKPGDEVRFDGQKLKAEKKVYLLLNKPKDFVSSTDDPHADKLVMDLVKNACEERIYPVGRLDRNTTGLLLFTNDGALSRKLTHPSLHMKKIYQVSLDKPLTKNHLEAIANGIKLEDGDIAADAISYINQEEKTEIGIEIHSGKNRIVRRVFEHFGYNVKKLDRVYFAGLTKKNLPRGKWRFLSDKEVQFLKMN